MNEVSNEELRCILSRCGEDAPVPPEQPRPKKVGGWTFFWMVVFFCFTPWRTFVQIQAFLLAARSYHEDNDGRR